MIALLEYFKRQKHFKIQEKYVLTKILVYLCILRHCAIPVFTLKRFILRIYKTAYSLPLQLQLRQRPMKVCYYLEPVVTLQLCFDVFFLV